MDRAEAERALRIMSLPWGKKQTGYVFLPTIDRKIQQETGIRRKGFKQGPAFVWPRDREKMIEYLVEKSRPGEMKDLYFTCSIFEQPMPQEDVAMNEHALWADLDEVDPSTLDDYPPTVAWESSPGHYQALWVAQTGDFLGASWPGNENQRMTYLIGADPSGWDTAQLLRVPGSENHKLEYQRKDGTFPKGKILWTNGPRYVSTDFKDLPEAVGAVDQSVTDALATDVDNVNRLEVIASVQLKLNRTARELLAAKDTAGADKSERLWYLIRCLADAGLSVAEIVAVARETVWNKFKDRHDELRRLIAEASKALAKRSEETLKKLEEDDDEDIDRPAPARIGFLLKNIKKPRYLVQGILTEGACGFIAGEPKSYKSWVGLDLAFSVATGADFLGTFRVADPGPVLYIQEEDPAPTLKNRSAKIWVNKSTDKFELVHTPEEAGLYWLPPEQDQLFDPDVNAYIQQGFIISNEAWQIWLDETLSQGMDGRPYKLLIIDTLMMTAGEVDENRSQEMTTKIFKPLKTLSRKHNVAIIIIHHMGKSERSRPGQRMLGAVANHAWAEDSIYLSRSGLKDIRIDLESKTIPASTYRMTEIQNVWWTPRIEPWRPDEDEEGENARPVRQRVRRVDPIIEQLKESATAMSTAELAISLNKSRSTIHKQCSKLLDQGKIQRTQMPGGSNVWHLD